jgi:hypothetical protein
MHSRLLGKVLHMDTPLMGLKPGWVRASFVAVCVDVPRD